MIIVANWKMNKNLDEINLFIDKFKKNIFQESNSSSRKIKILIAPSFTFLSHMEASFSSDKISIVAQNVCHEKLGSFTGEISAHMLKSINVEYIIIGHSERRIYFNEKDFVLEKKIAICLENNLSPIFCFGETVEDRESNNHLKIIERQLSVLPKKGLEKIILAYEPVWAIGSGKTPTTHQIQEVHNYVKQLYDCPILYGGSLNENNAKDLLSINEVDGGLIGGASLCPDTFYSIIQEATKIIELKT